MVLMEWRKLTSSGFQLPILAIPAILAIPGRPKAVRAHLLPAERRLHQGHNVSLTGLELHWRRSVDNWRILPSASLLWGAGL